MSSSVFYRFKSQKDYSKITIDGGSSTGLAVFDIKRDIINLEKLGNGQDFDLHIANADNPKLQYDDDAEVVPRGTSVIVSRRPPARGPGRGSAARYVTGNPVQVSSRRERDGGGGGGASVPAGMGGMQMPPPPPPVPGSGEDAAIRAMLAATSADWQQTQDRMANARPVFRTGQARPTGPVPDRPPPQGYICYRCGEKGHWIQACPTNGDETFDNRKRIKRTTGIPRSQLQKIDPASALVNGDGTGGGDGDDGQAGGHMVNADGESVMFVPDAASWETFKQKTEQSALARRKEKMPLPEGYEDIECTICGEVAKQAVRVPCCDKLACEECIQASLLESDFVCPFCNATDILLDRLKPDLEMRAKIEAYEKEYRGKKRGRDGDDGEANDGGDDDDSNVKAEPGVKSEQITSGADDATTTPAGELNPFEGMPPEMMAQQLMMMQQMMAMTQQQHGNDPNLPPPPTPPPGMMTMPPPMMMPGMMMPFGLPPPAPQQPAFYSGQERGSGGDWDQARDGGGSGQQQRRKWISRGPDPRFAHNIGKNKLIAKKD